MIPQYHIRIFNYLRLRDLVNTNSGMEGNMTQLLNSGIRKVMHFQNTEKKISCISVILPYTLFSF